MRPPVTQHPQNTSRRYPPPVKVSTRRRAVWLTLAAYVTLIFFSAFSVAALAGAAWMIWYVAIGGGTPWDLLYVPIGVWAAFHFGLSFGAIWWYRRGILRAYDVGDRAHAEELNSVRPLVMLGGVGHIELGSLPATWAIRFINGWAFTASGFAAGACLVAALIAERG